MIPNIIEPFWYLFPIGLLVFSSLYIIGNIAHSEIKDVRSKIKKSKESSKDYKNAMKEVNKMIEDEKKN